MQNFKRIVNTGEKMGRTIGFPTVNLEVKDLADHLKYGVYTCEVSVEGQNHKGMMHFGPTLQKEDPQLEIFIVDFDGDLYDKEISFTPLKFVREVLQFESFEDLKAQIEKDLQALND